MGSAELPVLSAESAAQVNPEFYWKCWPRAFAVESSGKGESLAHITEGMIRVSVTGDGFHELIAEEDDDSIPLVLHHHRRRR